MALIVTDQAGNRYSLIVDQVTGDIITTPVPNVSPSTNDNSISQTALNVIEGALRLIGAKAGGESVSGDDASDGLDVLDQMLDAWNADRLAIYTASTADYALVGGQQVYTLGPGGDFDTNRPARIDAMSAILLNNPSNPIEVPMNLYSVEDWQTKVPVKNVTGSFPLLCYDTGDFPLRSLNMWPIPSTSGNTVRIYSWQGLGIPSTFQTILSFPPGYAEAFRYNLAVRLAPEYQATLRPEVVAIAAESLARVKTMNAPDLTLRSDLISQPNGWNYRADLFGMGF